MPIFNDNPARKMRGRLSRRPLWAIAMIMGLVPLVAACGGVSSTSQTESQSGSSNASSTASSATSGKTTESTQQREVSGSGAEQANVAKTSYVVPTITCPSCSARVHASAMDEPGVTDTSIEGQDVTVTYDPQKTDPESIASAIREGGDTVKAVDG